MWKHFSAYFKQKLCTLTTISWLRFVLSTPLPSRNTELLFRQTPSPPRYVNLIRPQYELMNIQRTVLVDFVRSQKDRIPKMSPLKNESIKK